MSLDALRRSLLVSGVSRAGNTHGDSFLKILARALLRLEAGPSGPEEATRARVQELLRRLVSDSPSLRASYQHVAWHDSFPSIRALRRAQDSESALLNSADGNGVSETAPSPIGSNDDTVCPIGVLRLRSSKILQCM